MCSRKVRGALIGTTGLAVMGIHTIRAMAQSITEVFVTWRLCLLMWHCTFCYYNPIAYKEPVLKDKNEKDNDLGNGFWHHNEGKAQLLG